MNPDKLKTKVGEWLRGGPEGDVVISSRVRLARNVAGYPFVPRASEQEIQRIEALLSKKLLEANIKPELTYYRLDTMERTFVELLMERHLISHDHAEADWVRGVAFDADERVSVMVNEEDHLRIQVVRGGLRLEKVWEQINEIDDRLAELIPFAFSHKYGYLTACPTNVGTGMRASVMLHLPAVIICQEMENVVRTVQERHLGLRGFFGEGTQGSGDFYQLSNQVTLGVTEAEIIAQVTQMASHLVELEREARRSLLQNHRAQIEDRLNRAFEMLLSASMISSEEALHLLSQVRLGVAMNLIKRVRLERLNEVFLLTLPGHLQTMEGRSIQSLQRNELRARYVKERLTAD